MTNVIAWMGGSRPLKPTEISLAERNLVSYLFREQVADYNLFWGDMPTWDTLKTFWNRARHDAHATYREQGKTVAKPADPLSVQCPICHRPAGWICADPRGKGRWGRPHKTRVKLARGIK